MKEERETCTEWWGEFLKPWEGQEGKEGFVRNYEK